MTARWPLLALPVVTVAVVALALLTAAAPRPFRMARVFGGPTGGDRLALRVEVADVVESRGEVVERPVTGEKAAVRLWAARHEAARVLTLDSEGVAEVALDVPRGGEPLVIAVSQQGVELALGPIRLDSERWARAARRRGGWVHARAPGDYDVRVAPERGALAVPFEEGLIVEVARGGAPVVDAALELTATGGRITPREGRTDSRGRARFSLSPEEHALGVRVVVSHASARSEVTFGLGVVPGALRARLVGGALVVEAPVPRETAYVALVTEKERLWGTRIVFPNEGRGETSARIPLPILPSPPGYAVVATASDLGSAAAVGWPLAVRVDGEPAMTFDAREALLLDGRPLGSGRESARRARVRWATVAFCAVAVLLELALLLRYARASDRALDIHLEREGVLGDEARRMAPARSAAISLAIAAVALGFLLLAIAAVIKLG
jgi:hypothetical protein